MTALLQNLLQDLQYAVRQLWKSPGFTITAVLTLAIGIGANTGGFSIMDAVVLRPLAVPDLDQVVVVYEQKNHGDGQQVALANFEDWQRQNRSFEELAVRERDDLSLTGAGDAVHVQAEYLSPSFFSVLRTNALLGRVFSASETQPGANVVNQGRHPQAIALYNSPLLMIRPSRLTSMWTNIFQKQQEKKHIRQEIEVTSTAKLAPPLNETELIQSLVCHLSRLSRNLSNVSRSFSF